LLLVLDSSILMLAKPGALNFDEIESIIGRVKLSVPRAVLEELQNISNGRGIKAKKARFALGIIDKKGIEIINVDAEEGDFSLLNIAERDDVIIATMDSNIIENLKRRGKKVITMRNERLVLLD